MVEIYVQLVNEEVVSIEMIGHADSNQRGKDLVCAGLSAVITGGASAINEVKDFDIKLKSGNSHIIAKADISEKDKIVLETIYKQLQCIENSNRKFVKIIRK